MSSSAHPLHLHAFAWRPTELKQIQEDAQTYSWLSKAGGLVTLMLLDNANYFWFRKYRCLLLAIYIDPLVAVQAMTMERLRTGLARSA